MITHKPFPTEPYRQSTKNVKNLGRKPPAWSYFTSFDAKTSTWDFYLLTEQWACLHILILGWIDAIRSACIPKCACYSLYTSMKCCTSWICNICILEISRSEQAPLMPNMTVGMIVLAQPGPPQLQWAEARRVCSELFSQPAEWGQRAKLSLESNGTLFIFLPCSHRSIACRISRMSIFECSKDWAGQHQWHHHLFIALAPT